MTLENLKLSTGFFERNYYEDGNLILKGWMYVPDIEFDKFLLFINEEHAGDFDIVIRADVGKVHKHIPHAKNSGFNITVPMSDGTASKIVDISLVGLLRGKPIGKMETFFSTAVKQPDYPPHLMDRVVATRSADFFWSMAFRAFREFWKGVCRHKEPGEIKRMLDWGCGCGRLIPFFQQLTGIPEVYGCDIDSEPIEWCTENLPEADFKVIPPYPPTDYPDNSFDLVIGFSVFTHLTREIQHDWLKEMKRVIAPGGLLLVTTHGDYIINTLPRKMRDNCMETGFNDDHRDTHFDGDAPHDYYRGTYQTEKYTREVFGQYFDILEYIGDGAMNMQDLVIMKKG